MTKKETFKIPKITFIDVIRWIFPISMMIIFWVLIHMYNRDITSTQLLIGLRDFIIQLGALYSVYLLSSSFMDWLIEKLIRARPKSR